MLGIIIGVSALIVLVSIADGASSSVSEQISDMGSSYLTVRVTDDKENPIRLSEFHELMDDEALEAAAPYGRTSVTAKSGYTSGTMNITGTTGSYFDIMNLELSSGRTLKQTDLDNHSLVVIISADTAVEFLEEKMQWEKPCLWMEKAFWLQVFFRTKFFAYFSTVYGRKFFR